MEQDDAAGDGRHESVSERADRNWDELMQELRVTQTGTQILTGFLLTLPFQQRFADLSGDQVVLYLVLVALSLTATVLVLAPVSLHRLLFRHRRKPELVTVGSRLAQVGLLALALVVTGTALFVFDVVVGRGAGIAAAACALALVLGLWVALPRMLRRQPP